MYKWEFRGDRLYRVFVVGGEGLEGWGGGS